MAPSSNLRLFFALELPDEVTRHLGNVTKKLYLYRLPNIKWVNRQNIHLTLKFLGSTPDNMLDSLNAVTQTVVASVSPFTLEIEGIGTFPRMSRPRILWAGVRGNLEAMFDIKNRLDQALETQGFAKDQRPFSPHLTIGRINYQLSPQELERLHQAIEEVNNLSSVYMPVNAVSLIESRLTRDGAVYSKTAQYELGAI